MKKLFLLSVVTAGLFTSCVQNDLIAPELSESEKEIKFQTVVAKHSSRAIITGTAYGKDAPTFGTYVFKNPSGSMPGDIEHVPLTEIVFHDETTDYWAPSNVNYTWPPAGTLTAFSYSPFRYQEDETDNEGNVKDKKENTPLVVKNPQIGQHGFIFENYDVHNHQQTDLMVADVRYNLTANIQNGGYTGIPTLFKHKLSMIGGFILATSEDYDGEWDGETLTTAKEGNMRFLIKKIEFKNISTEGTFKSAGVKGDGSAIDEEWTVTSDESELMSYVWFESDTGVEFGHVQKKQLHIYNAETTSTEHKYIAPTITNGYILTIPQEFGNQSQAELEITYMIQSFDANGGDENSGAWVNTKDNDIVRNVKLSAIHATNVNGANPYGGWEIGKKIVYILEFSTEEIRWAPYVEEWEKKEIKIDY